MYRAGKYNKHYEKGTYVCVVCSQELFSSDTKYDSGCGWPAFNDVLEQGKVKLLKDASLGKQFSLESFLLFKLSTFNTHFIAFN